MLTPGLSQMIHMLVRCMHRAPADAGMQQSPGLANDACSMWKCSGVAC